MAEDSEKGLIAQDKKADIKSNAQTSTKIKIDINDEKARFFLLYSFVMILLSIGAGFVAYTFSLLPTFIINFAGASAAFIAFTISCWPFLSRRFPTHILSKRNIFRVTVAVLCTIVIFSALIVGVSKLNSVKAAMRIQATAQAQAQATAQVQAKATAQAQVQTTAQAKAQATTQAQAQATTQAYSRATATAVVAASSYPFGIKGTYVFYDRLINDDNKYSWNVTDHCKFIKGGYQVSTANKSPYNVCLAGESSISGNFTYQVELQIVQGDCGGIVFHVADKTDFDFFMICQNGKYVIGTARDDNYIFVGCGVSFYSIPSCGPSDSIVPNHINTIAAVLKGSDLRIYINNAKSPIINLVDPDFIYGNGSQIGLIAYSITQLTYINFNSVKVNRVIG